MVYTVAISGLYSGRDPAPGVGVARSIRVAFPTVRLIGVEYSDASTGMAWRDFDEARILELPIGHQTLKEITGALASLLYGCDAFIPGYDPEAWLCRELPESSRALSPDSSALDAAAKPELRLATVLGLSVPATLCRVGDLAGERTLSFCEEHDWNLWAKSVWYGAARVHDRGSLARVAGELLAEWGPESVWLQANVDGVQETVAFCAHEGELLGTASMVKVQVTPEGKVWSGTIGSTPPELVERLTVFLRDVRWTGGGELEIIRDARGERWLIECNPRFPSWMWAATLSGRNLPALLLSRALELDLPECTEPAEDFAFARVVTEIPVPEGVPVPEPYGHGQFEHPSRMARLVRLLDRGPE